MQKKYQLITLKKINRLISLKEKNSMDESFPMLVSVSLQKNVPKLKIGHIARDRACEIMYFQLWVSVALLSCQ